jgi:CRP-like cAMP-binding protein
LDQTIGVPAENSAFLSGLSPQDAAAVRERLKPFRLTNGMMLGEIGKPITQVIFPRSGLISVVAELTSGERIETALIGYDGVFGGAFVFGAKTHITMSYVQMPGEALALPASELLVLADESESLAAMLFRYEQYLLVQVQQSVACNARHQLRQRLGTWLLRARDTADQKRLHLTQEFLSQMLGVKRASVSVVAGELQAEGLIRYRRGVIDILDEKGLAEVACECRKSVNMQYRRLFKREGLN